MSLQVARVGDRVFGIWFSPDGPVPCGGEVVTGASHACVNGDLVAIQGSQVLLDCGGTAEVLFGSFKTCSDGIPVALWGATVWASDYIGNILDVRQNKVFGV